MLVARVLAASPSVRVPLRVVDPTIMANQSPHNETVDRRTEP
jgi:hypothetical protein